MEAGLSIVSSIPIAPFTPGLLDHQSLPKPCHGGHLYLFRESSMIFQKVVSRFISSMVTFSA